MDWVQLIAGVIVILGGIWAMLKFLLKDTHKQLQILEKEHIEYREDMKKLNLIFNRQWVETNARLDGIYKVLLDKTYSIK